MLDPQLWCFDFKCHWKKKRVIGYLIWFVWTLNDILIFGLKERKKLISSKFTFIFISTLFILCLILHPCTLVCEKDMSMQSKKIQIFNPILLVLKYNWFYVVIIFDELTNKKNWWKDKIWFDLAFYFQKSTKTKPIYIHFTLILSIIFL